jgi:lipid-binding SYLF domain-containing protein
MKSMMKMAQVVMVMVLASVVTAHAERDKELEAQVKEALRLLKQKDSTFESALGKAHGYAIFPAVGKGGFIVGGAGGKGEVYQGSELIGTAKLSQATIGAQIGGQSFIEVILFADRIALNKFKRGDFELSAGVSAVAAAEGVADKADYKSGMAVIILPKAGLMVEASVGGQKFSFKPVEESD